MILTALTDQTAYRVHTPRWAFAPTSGHGAAKHGGRLNRPGIPALYLSLDTKTAIEEYRQVSKLLRPGTMVCYQVTVDQIVDFGSGFNTSDWDANWQDFYCDWRELWFNGRIEPPSWAIGDMVVASGAKGVLFQSSFVENGTNLVLYNDALLAHDSLTVFDPGGELPKNQDSWK